MRSNRDVRWSLVLNAEVITEYAGVKLGQYYSDPETMLRAQLEAQRLFHELYGVPLKKRVYPDYGSYVEATQLGAEMIFPDDDVPWIKEPVLGDIRDVWKLRILDPMTEGMMARVIETYYYMKRQVADDVEVVLGGTEGPITTAVLLRGDAFFLDLYDRPKEAHQLLKLITEASLLIRHTIERVTGRKITSTGIADDYAGLLSPELYEQFAYPYQKTIYEEFGKQGRILHSELFRRDHLRFLQRLGISLYDPGVDRYLTISDLKETGIPFSWNLRGVDDIMRGTPEGIRGIYREAVEKGAPRIVTELYRDTPQQNIKAFVEIAREYGPGGLG